MSTGGYILSKYSWTGTGSGDTEQLLNTVLSNIVQTICENSNWEMDTRTIDGTQLHSSVDDYSPSQISMYNYEYYPYGGNSYTGYNKICFLTNGNLFLAIGITTGCAKFKDSDIIVPVTQLTHSSNVVARNSITGLYFSISKTGVWSVSASYGIELPSDATKWTSFGRVKGYYDSWGNLFGSLLNFVRDNTANVIYSYYFLIKENQIAIFEKCSSWGTDKIKCIICGDLIGAFAHVSDTNSLCCISLSENLYNTSSSTTDPGNRGESTAPESVINSDYYINQEANYCYRYYNNNSNTQIFRADGSIAVPYNSTSNTGVSLSVSNTIQLNTMVSNTTDGGSRWCPLQIMILSNDPITNGVIENDGFKGYLDTDLVRSVTIGEYSLGSTFGNNQEFVYIGGGLIIGWDSSNTESIF